MSCHIYATLERLHSLSVRKIKTYVIDFQTRENPPTFPSKTMFTFLCKTSTKARNWNFSWHKREGTKGIVLHFHLINHLFVTEAEELLNYQGLTHTIIKCCCGSINRQRPLQLLWEEVRSKVKIHQMAMSCYSPT